MPLQQLSSLGTYEEINAGAHRKAASIVGVPAIVRHIGFWNTGFSGEDQVQGRLSNGKRVESYNAYATDLGALVSNATGGIRPSGMDPISYHAAADNSAVTLLRFWWHDVFTTIRLEFHTEYITVTSILDFSVKAPEASEQGFIEHDVRKTIRHHLDQLASHVNDVQAIDNELCGQTSAYFQIEIWDEFERAVLDHGSGEQTLLGRRFGEVFVDMRGILTGSCRGTAEDAVGSGASGQGTPRFALRKPFTYEIPRRRMFRKREHGPPPPGWAQYMVGQLWPFIETEGHLYDYEFSVSRFLQGRALFATALGPRPSPQQGDKMQWSPIRWFVHAYTDDEWQLGRLIDRLNTLGTLRLAATMEITALRNAGEKVEKLAADIEKAEQAVGAAIRAVEAETVPGTPLDEDTETSSGVEILKSDEAVIAANERLDAVEMKLKEINEEISGDIFYRLERSDYYFQRFDQEAVGLRARRLEGYQLYQELVTRRLSGIRGYFQLLRARMDDIHTGRLALNERYASLKITKVTYNIDGLVKQLNAQDRAVANIQEIGEYALILFLIPYYIGSALIHGFEVHGLHARVAWTAIIVVCALLAAFRARKNRKLLAGLAVGYLLFVLVTSIMVPGLLLGANAHEQSISRGAEVHVANGGNQAGTQPQANHAEASHP